MQAYISRTINSLKQKSLETQEKKSKVKKFHNNLKYFEQNMELVNRQNNDQRKSLNMVNRKTVILKDFLNHSKDSGSVGEATDEEKFTLNLE